MQIPQILQKINPGRSWAAVYQSTTLPSFMVLITCLSLSRVSSFSLPLESGSWSTTNSLVTVELSLPSLHTGAHVSTQVMWFRWRSLVACSPGDGHCPHRHPASRENDGLAVLPAAHCRSTLRRCRLGSVQGEEDLNPCSVCRTHLLLTHLRTSSPLCPISLKMCPYSVDMT